MNSLFDVDRDVQSDIQNLIETIERGKPPAKTNNRAKQNKSMKLPKLKAALAHDNPICSSSRKTAIHRGVSCKNMKKRVSSTLVKHEDPTLSDESVDEEELGARIAREAITAVGKRIENNEDPLDLQLHEVLPDAAEKLSSESQLHLLKTKIHIINVEKEKLENNYQDKVSEHNSLLTQYKKIQEVVKTKDTQVTVQNNQLNRLKKVNDELSFKLQSTTHDLDELKKEILQEKQAVKQKTLSISNLENKLGKSLEELKYLRQAEQEAQKRARDAYDNSKQKVVNLEKTNLKLEKEKNLLINGLKKQTKLIEILKKQKLHLEAAKVLEFCENDFMKLLDLDKK